MKQLGLLLAGALLLAGLTACEKTLEVEGAEEGSSVLNVVTRSGEQDRKVSYPVTVYVMNSDGQCVRRQQLTSASDAIQLRLQPLTYDIYAVGGAADGDYTLPGQDDAVATSEVALNADASHGDLMTAHNALTLAADGTTTLTLTMNRRVMQIASLVIKNVPISVSDVSVSLSPLYDNLLLDGTYTTTTSSETVSLAVQSDGTTWQNAEPCYLLPSSGNATITVNFTKNSTVTSYAYQCPIPLQANRRISITGTFTGTEELTLTGVVTGAAWDGTTEIEFTFDGTGATTVSTNNTDDNTGTGGGETGGDDDVTEGAAPEAKTIYKDCYVNSVVNDETGNYLLVTLIHKDEEDISGKDNNGNEKTEEQIMAEINAALPSFDINGITGWRLPTEEEANTFRGEMNDAFSKNQVSGTDISNHWYYCLSGSQLSLFLGNSGYVNKNLSLSYGQHLRPVTTLKFRK